MPAHGSRGDETTISKALQLFAVYVSSLLPLSPPMFSGCYGAVEHTVQIRCNDLLIMGDLTIKSWTLSPRDTCIRYEDVETTVEVFDALIGGFPNLIDIRDIHLIGFACQACKLESCFAPLQQNAQVTPKSFSISAARSSAVLLL